jgi:hypothetical protein
MILMSSRYGAKVTNKGKLKGGKVNYTGFQRRWRIISNPFRLRCLRDWHDTTICDSGDNKTLGAI